MRYGTMSTKELLNEVQQKGISCVALTDINNTSASLNFLRLAQKQNIKPVTGIDFRNGVQQQFVGIARNNEGFYELNHFLSYYLHNGERIPDRPPNLKNTYIIYPYKKYTGWELLDNEYLGIAPSDLNRIKFTPWESQRDKLVVLQTATFRNKRDFNTHRLLRAIDNNTLLSKLPKSEEGRETDKLLPQKELLKIYYDYPEIIANTEYLLKNCEVRFEFGSEFPPKNKKTYTSSEEEDFKMLTQLCREGITYRYPDADQKIMERLDMELEIIRQKQFVPYFLINWDIVSYARRQGYFYVGRGSGANSIVAYLLRITDVDPVELDLYFERFINLFRKNPPDFDIDFSWQERDDVISYIFNRFPNVALLAAFSTFQRRAAIHELGKVFGLPRHEIEVLTEGRYQSAPQDHISSLVLKYSERIHGFPSHLSIHAGGILISEKPIHYYTATTLPPKGFPLTHFDMLVAEDIGLYKFDILSQRGLGKIKDALAIVRQNNPGDEPIDIHDVKRFKQDTKVKHLLKNAKAIGCFYVESPAMRMLLKKMEVDNYLGLVAASSIIRPGVSKSGMMREYILRLKNPERRKDVNPLLMNIMPETFGVMVYQEDVIKVAHYFAGLTLSEADVLRRGMSGKYRSREEFTKAKNQFFNNCREKKYDPQLTADIWRQIESFAGYAFAKGHSASYAVESYQSLYLKAYYPLEYMVAVINNFGGFYRSEIYVNEARINGGAIHAPDINKSEWLTTIYGHHIYIGLQHLHALDSGVAEQIIRERNRNGMFDGFDDFMERVSISLEQISILIRVDAFRFTHINKRELLWKAHFILNIGKKEVQQKQLFISSRKNYNIPALIRSKYEDAFDHIELLHFPLINPFALTQHRPGNNLTAHDLPIYLGKTISLWGYFVTRKETRTAQKKIMFFGTFLDRDGFFFDTTHFPPVAAAYPVRGKGIYKVTGKVVEEFGFYSIEVERMEKEKFIEDPRYSEKELPLEKQLVDLFYQIPYEN
jgi:DNA polymerase-3 subunit alpha